VVPTRQSLRPIDRPVSRMAFPRTGTEHFFTSHAAPARPMPFEQRASEIQHMVQTQNPNAAGNREGASGGFQRLGTPRNPAPGTPLRTFQNGQSREGEWPPAVNMAGRNYPAPNRAQPSQRNGDAGWRRFSSQPRPAGNQRFGGWNAPAPQGGYGRQPLQLRRPIVRQPSYTPRSYGSGRPAPSGGNRSSSAPARPSGGASRSAPAPRGGGGGRR